MKPAPQFDDLFSIRGKVALVTGGSRGLGEMIAAGFLAAGAKVYISSRKAAAFEDTAKRLSQAYGGQCIALPSDLSKMDGVQSLAARLTEREERLDILVNNAGAAWGAKLEDFPEAGWDKVMDTNLKAPFFLTQQLAPLLRESAKTRMAKVINIASVDGISVNPWETYSYHASKSGLIHL
ncbi:MAG: SDR family NAD(P)-dependent oxidoreductase, partial [Quisquiliibacterium sp.]